MLWTHLIALVSSSCSATGAKKWRGNVWAPPPSCATIALGHFSRLVGCYNGRAHPPASCYRTTSRGVDPTARLAIEWRWNNTAPFVLSCYSAKRVWDETQQTPLPSVIFHAPKPRRFLLFRARHPTQESAWAPQPSTGKRGEKSIIQWLQDD